MKIPRSGFSLIELMIVVVIIGILTAFAIPSYQAYTLKARYAEVLAAAEPFKLAVALALQQGFSLDELKNNAHGIPAEPLPTPNLASLKVENGVILAVGSEKVKGATYLLKPNADGSRWTISGSCLKLNWCDS